MEKKNLWMKVLSIKGKKVKTFHREKGDRHDQNVTLLILKEIKGSQDVLSLTFFSFFCYQSTKHVSKAYVLLMIHYRLCQHRNSLLFFLSCFCFCLRHDNRNRRGKKAHTHEWWLPCNIPMWSVLTSQISFSFYQKSIVFALCTHSASPFSFLEITRRNYKWLLTWGIGICTEYLQRIK